MRTAPIWFGVGLFAIQLVWALAIGSFGGYDEHAHYFRAVSIPNGTWLGEEVSGISDAVRLVEVPGDQFPGCPEDPYTCPLTAPPLGGADVEFGTSAAVYPPAYYATVGLLAAPFPWPASLLVMRVSTALLTSALAVGCYWIGRQVWPRGGNGLALMAISTPATVFLGATVTPSGVEIWATTGTVMTMFGIVREVAAGRQAPRSWRILLVVMAAALILNRPMSPVVFVGSSIAVAMALVAPRRLPGFVGTVIRRYPVVVTALVAVAVVAAAWSLPTWPRDPSANSTPLPDGTAEAIVFLRTKLWQQWNAMIGVPNDWIVSPFAHLLLTMVAISLVGLSALVASRRLALVMGGLVTAILFIGVPATLAAGFAWYQGRYAIPALAVLFVLAGDRLESSQRLRALTARRFTISVASAWAIAQVLYPLEYFGFPGAKNIAGVDVWPSSFAGKIDRVPEHLMGVGIMITLAIGVILVGGMAVINRVPVAEVEPIDPSQVMAAPDASAV